MRVLHVGHGFRPFHHGGLVGYAEDLMDAQVARGDEISYFFSGRSYPLGGPRVWRWRRRGVRMYELLNPPVIVAPGDRGTRRPAADLQEERSERLFAEVLGAVRPDVVHVQELAGIPSSVLEHPGWVGVPVLMTLQDYSPLCPTVKLFDVDGAVCLRREPASECVRCCRDAPADDRELMRLTLRHHRRQATRRFPALVHLPGPSRLERRDHANAGSDAAATPLVETRAKGHDRPVDEFRARREVNVARLSRVDALVAMSDRVAQIYTQLGVAPDRIRVMRLTLGHIAQLHPRTFSAAGRPVRFVTLGGCASAAKGAQIVIGAIEQLARTGMTADDLTLSVAGHVDPAVEERLTACPLVRLVGDYSSGDLDALLDRHDVGLVPSVWEEAFGYVGLELLAKGLPVIGNAIGGIGEYTRDGETGWLNHDRSASGLAQIMHRIIDDPEEVVRLHTRTVEARAGLVQPVAQHAEQIALLYAELVADRSRATR